MQMPTEHPFLENLSGICNLIYIKQNTCSSRTTLPSVLPISVGDNTTFQLHGLDVLKSSLTLFFPWYIPSNESANCVSSPFQSVFKLELLLTAYGSTTLDKTTKISDLDDCNILLTCLSIAADLNITAGENLSKACFQSCYSSAQNPRASILSQHKNQSLN